MFAPSFAFLVALLLLECFKVSVTKPEIYGNIARNIRETSGICNYDQLSSLIKVQNVSRYENTPMQYTAIFHSWNNDNFQRKNCDIFLTFAQKHRSWVQVRIASVMRF